MQTLWQDLRYAIRTLLKNRSFAIVVVLALALGIGACTAIFSVVNAVLLKPLPYPESDRLVAIQEQRRDGGRSQVTPANFLDWRAQQTSFSSLSAYLTRSVNLTGASEPERVTLAVASASFFDTLGTQPQLGRLFLPTDEQPGHNLVVVLGHGLWQRRFGGDRDVIGKTIMLDGQSYSVIGVTPPSFQFPKEADLWSPPLQLVPEVSGQANVAQVRGFGSLAVIGRLKPGVAGVQAQAEMETITARLRQQYPDTNSNRFNRVVSLQTQMVGEIKLALLVLLGAVGCVLLIACANVANLLLARTTGRRKELAIRVALGAGRARVIQQLLTESALLALLGGLSGLLLASWGVDVLLALAPADLPRMQEVSVDWRVFGFALALSLLTGLLFGLAPALQLARQDIHRVLKDGARGTIGQQGSFLRSALVVAEVAISLVLLIGAGLLARSFLKLQTVEAGFDPQQVLTLRVAPSGEKYREDAQYQAFYELALQRLRALLGVEAVGAISTLPLAKGRTAGFRIEGRAPLPPSEWPGANFRIISPDYFRALGVPLTAGRDFSERDNDQAPNVVVINQALARKTFPGENPLGKRINFGASQNNQPVWYEIVGVVADARTLELSKEPEPDVFMTYRQVAPAAFSFVIRTQTEPESLAAAARQVFRELDPNLPIANLKPLEQIVYETVAQPRFNVLLFGVFALVALVLAAAGIYGVLSYTVSQRTNEIGIRMALGARGLDVLRLVIGQGMKLAGAGVGVGLVVAYGMTRLLTGLLFGVQATDPLTFAGIAGLLLFVALLACWIPARRATKVDPLMALRCE